MDGISVDDGLRQIFTMARCAIRRPRVEMRETRLKMKPCGWKSLERGWKMGMMDNNLR
jgi:hypothetical protein